MDGDEDSQNLQARDVSPSSLTQTFGDLLIITLSFTCKKIVLFFLLLLYFIHSLVIFQIRSISLGHLNIPAFSTLLLHGPVEHFILVN